MLRAQANELTVCLWIAIIPPMYSYHWLYFIFFIIQANYGKYSKDPSVPSFADYKKKLRFTSGAVDSLEVSTNGEDFPIVIAVIKV